MVDNLWWGLQLSKVKGAKNIYIKYLIWHDKKEDNLSVHWIESILEIKIDNNCFKIKENK